MKGKLRIVLSALALLALGAWTEPSCGIGTSPSLDDEPEGIVCGIGTSPSGPCKAAPQPEGGVIIQKK